MFPKRVFRVPKNEPETKKPPAMQVGDQPALASDKKTSNAI
jgi:hypothetical protein